MGKRKSQGLGDSIEAFTEATGIKKAVELFSEITGLDCGCDERKEKLNRIFPYKNVNCLNEPDYIYLKDFFATNPSQLSVQVQRDLSGIYKNVFNVNLEASSCSSCWRDYVSQIRRIYNEY